MKHRSSKMTTINFEQKGLFTFTGNPIIDNGMAVLANIAEKEKLYEITPEGIEKNIDAFFNKIKHQYNDENAEEKEKKHGKKKLRHHLTALYTTNHYLHGINNKSNCLINITISVEEKEEFFNKLQKASPAFYLSIVDEKKGKLRVFNKNKTFLEKSKFIEFLDSIELPEYQIKNYSQASVESNEEYYSSFKSEIRNTLSKKSKTLMNKERKEQNCICNFCGKQSEIRLSKDIFPLTSPKDDLNLGTVHTCNYCYLASLFYFFNLINFKSEKALKKGKSGMYFFYHFSHPEVMIEYSKNQIAILQNEKLASLKTVIGGKYSSAFDYLYKQMMTLNSIKKYHPSVTIYFLLNDNRGAVYENFSLPNGLLNFWLTLQTPEGKEEWFKVHSQLNSAEDYHAFVNGGMPIRKFGNNKKETVITYLKEVTNMNQDLIKACEQLSSKLIDYFKEIHEKNPTRRDNWTAEIFDFFQLKKSHEFFNNLLGMNNDYFRWTGGENLLPVSSMKIILEDFKKYNLLYRLIEYFILNSFDKEAKEQYLSYFNKKTNA